MPSRLAAVALLGALLAAGGAPAAADERPMLRTERRMSEFAPDALPTPFSPFHLMRATALPMRALELFGEGLGFALGSDVSLIEIEGGAAWHVLDSLSLTASYRVLDVHLGADVEVGAGAGRRADFGAPFLGVAVDF
jgi:hypothetical protein